MCNSDKILVVIPYSVSGSQGRELWYAVEGWRKHFKEDFLIVVVGDYHPVCETGDDIVSIVSPKVDKMDGMYRQHLDYVNCLKKVHSEFPDGKGFIQVADDCYAVRDFTFDDVRTLRKLSDEMKGCLHSGNGWQVDKARTRILLEKEGYLTRNYTTHLPQWYEWGKIEKLWDKYDMAHTSYVVEDLYYNIYHGNEDAVQVCQFDNIKLSIQDRSLTEDSIKSAIGKKIWINNSPIGWGPVLDKVLSDYYGV